MSGYPYAFQNLVPQNQQHLPRIPNPAATTWETAFSSPAHQQRYVLSPGAAITTNPLTHSVPPSGAAQLTSIAAHPATLLWTDLEIWMDAEYVRQVCTLLRWDVAARVPPAGSNELALAGVRLNTSPPPSDIPPLNAGFCVLTFASREAAGAALTQTQTTTTASSTSPAVMKMPNSSRPFVLNWAPPGIAPATTSVLSNSASGSTDAPPAIPLSTRPPAVGLTYNAMTPAAPIPEPPAHEYSIFVGDLAPETSNSDLVAVFRNPVLGLRNDRVPKIIRPFTSCKSAKIMLDPVTGVSRGYGFVRFTDEMDQQRALVEMHGLYCLSRPMRISPATAKFRSSAELPSIASVSAGLPSHPNPAEISEEWKHHAQARAILGHMMGPNGEQLTSTDPYNTTVFVGGLSPLIQEDTLKSFFAPFGDIHYVKVPVGKHCGFVQFVRKADAERAIETMQGFHIGGSRIRLSWGRSQYKAAQAAAQAAQAAALQAASAVPSPAPPVEARPPSITAPLASNGNLNDLTHEQALALLQKLGYGQSASPPHTDGSMMVRRDDAGLAFGYPARAPYEVGGPAFPLRDPYGYGSASLSSRPTTASEEPPRDSMHDLNGTLAGLNLDPETRSWGLKTPSGSI
ncbi:unnamed protein product [Mycena citricolor]|uniref:RRM domain-containing protein n=1 Tax=Mycena citricolor TaxID=2018698 RepID=A0AAD2HAV5_9AGAR|nr:unnamed protein product [Mycena citricolor]